MSVEIEVKFEVTETRQVYFGVECDSCGSVLKATYHQRFETLYIEPCEKCLEKAREEGREEVENA